MALIKICGLCREEYEAKYSNQKYCNQIKIKKCPVDGVELFTKCVKKIATYCSGSCAMKSKDTQQKIRETNLEKYGVESIFQIPSVKEKAVKESWSDEARKKRSDTMIERYGADNIMRNEDYKNKVLNEQRLRNDGKLAFNTEKQKQTNLKKYGYITPAKNEKVKEKSKQTQYENHGGKYAFNTEKQKETMIERYGGKGSLSSEEVRERQEQTMLSRYGVRKPFQNSDFLEKYLSTIIEHHGRLFGNGSKISKINKNYASLIKEKFNLEVEFEKQFSTIFVDLYISELNLAIDINPTITHNSTKAFQCLREKCPENCEKHNPVASDYHYKRLLKMEELKTSYISIWDWDYENEVITEIAFFLQKDWGELINSDNSSKIYISGLEVDYIKEPAPRKVQFKGAEAVVFDQGTVYYK